MLPLLFASLAVACTSLIGVACFGLSDKIRTHIHYVISISVGVFLGVAFGDLIPEAIEKTPEHWGGIWIACGFLFFFGLSHILSYYHHHHRNDACSTCTTGKMVLIGDSIHNFVDGITIAGAFAINPTVGIAATMGVILHELPQEIAEFFILLKSGYTKSKAVLLNGISALSVVLGSVFAYFFISSFEEIVGPLLGIAAGNILYIAGSDLIPELTEHHKHTPDHNRTFWKQFGLIILGVIVAIGFGLIMHHE